MTVHILLKEQFYIPHNKFHEHIKILKPPYEWLIYEATLRLLEVKVTVQVTSRGVSIELTVQCSTFKGTQSRVGKRSTFLIFPQISIIFSYFSSNFSSFMSSFWSSRWVSHPPGKTLATPLKVLHDYSNLQ